MYCRHYCIPLNLCCITVLYRCCWFGVFTACILLLQVGTAAVCPLDESVPESRVWCGWLTGESGEADSLRLNNPDALEFDFCWYGFTIACAFCQSLPIYIYFCIFSRDMTRNGAVGAATLYGLDCPGIESWRSECPRRLRRRSVAACLLGLRFRIPMSAWLLCVLYNTG
jgi:hypothetical protein